MSGNGIGLKTARGSGTSGYVSRSLASIGDKVAQDYAKERISKKKSTKQSNTQKAAVEESLRSDLLTYQISRKIEQECARLRDKLEDDDISDEEIEKRVTLKRNELLERLEEDSGIISDTKSGTEEGDEGDAPGTSHKRETEDKEIQKETEKKGPYASKPGAMRGETIAKDKIFTYEPLYAKRRR